MSQYDPVLEHRKQKLVQVALTVLAKAAMATERIVGIAISGIIITCILNLSNVSESLLQLHSPKFSVSYF